MKERQDAAKKKVLRRVRCLRNDLEPGVQVGTLGCLRASRYGRTCTPGFRCAPVVVNKGQGECLRTLSRTAEDVREV